MTRGARDLNRYPDGGAFRLRAALADRRGVAFEEVAVGAGADGVIDCVSQAFLDSGDEVVCGWPSFPSYVIDALKLGATPVRVPLTDARYDLDALLAAITQRTKVVYLCHPNNPTGTMNTREELDVYFERVAEHVLTVLDQAYFEYIDDPDYADGIDYFRQGHRVLVVRTFSKIYGLAGLRVGWGVGSRSVVAAIGKVRRAFDLNTQAQVAAVASLDDEAEVERRRRVNAEERQHVVEILERHGFDCTGPAVANFVYAESGEEDARPLFEALLRAGVIVRPLEGFGAPSAIRVTVGSPEDNAALDEALGRVRAAAGA
jgi:histidinol-phosphate aminotransferase